MKLSSIYSNYTVVRKLAHNIYDIQISLLLVAFITRSMSGNTDLQNEYQPGRMIGDDPRDFSGCNDCMDCS